VDEEKILARYMRFDLYRSSLLIFTPVFIFPEENRVWSYGQLGEMNSNSSPFEAFSFAEDTFGSSF
jgi:hypothetical protein